MLVSGQTRLVVDASAGAVAPILERIGHAGMAAVDLSLQISGGEARLTALLSESASPLAATHLAAAVADLPGIFEVVLSAARRLDRAEGGSLVAWRDLARWPGRFAETLAA